MRIRRLTLTVILILVFSLEYIQIVSSGGPLLPLDEPTVEMFRGGKQYAFMFSWDDGGDDLLFSFLEDELGFRHTTFAITSFIQNRKLWGLDMLFRGHDIQSHSRNHVHHASINASYCEYLLQKSIDDIENVYGYTPILFAYPYGSKNKAAMSLVQKYFKIGRGIEYESMNEIGSWPIERTDSAPHSFPSVHGVQGSTISSLISSFNKMVSYDDDIHRAYKCYGHSKWFNESERYEFFEALKEIAFRNDTWYTSWGEAVAYQIQRNNVRISRYLSTNSTISFVTSIERDFEYGIPITYRVEVPSSWSEVSVFDGEKISDRYFAIEEDSRKYLLIDSAPIGQTIKVIPIRTEDTSNPVIENLRILATDEGIAFIADVYDKESLIRDVNMTIRGYGEVYQFHRVSNPVFWANSTYGRVVFKLQPGCYTCTVTALDSNGNRASLSRCIELA
ncbi:MAG: polysaccharide deacetylase family protein [Candidatus Thorarchaeota archaeon]